jgi:NADH:quinone reductase (non-electrogenic)
MSGATRPRVVIIGGGFGGLFAAKFLRHVAVDVTVVDRTNHHLFQPLLYQVATGMLSEGEVAPPIREVLRHHRNVTVVLANVTAVDLEGRTLSASRPAGDPLTLAFDYLIVAAGASGSYFGHDEFGRFAPGMKTIDDALELRGRIFGAFEMAETESDPAAREAWLTFAVIGGGPTGVEMAGQIAELARRSLTGNFRAIDPATARVLVFDGGEEVLAMFGDRLSGKATKELERLGVELHMRSRVTDVTRDGIVVAGPDGEERYRTRTKVWAAGVQASPLGAMVADASGAKTDRAGRVLVLPDCTLPGHPEVFVIGDLMALDHLPGVAEVAMQSGIHAATTIKRRLRADASAKAFRYRDLGSMATVARFRAIVSFKGIRVSGFVGWLMWAFVHITFLTGFRNRFNAAVHWVGAFLGKARIQRTITVQQVAGRIVAMDAGLRPNEMEMPTED